MNAYKITCKLRRLTSGTMYVRADVGGSGIGVEQAQVHVKVTPVALVAKIDRRFIGEHDSIKIALEPFPAGKSVSAATISGGTAWLTSTSCSGALCKGTAQSSGSIVVTALVNGVTKNAQVSVTTVPCPTGDSTLDNPVVRDMLVNLERIGNKTSPPKEMRGYVFRDTVTHIEKFVIDSTNTNNTCYSSQFAGSTPPRSVPVAGAHTHPFSLNKRVTCRPPGTIYVRGTRGGLPSSYDWNEAGQWPFPHVILDNDLLARYGPTTVSDTVTVKDVTTHINQIPDSTEFANAYFETTRRPNGCTRP